MTPFDILMAFKTRGGELPPLIPEPDRVAARALARMRPEIVAAVLEVAGRFREFAADRSAMVPRPRLSVAWLATNWRACYRWLHPDATDAQLDALQG